MTNLRVRMKSNQRHLKIPLTSPSPQRGKGKGEGDKRLEESCAEFVIYFYLASMRDMAETPLIIPVFLPALGCQKRFSSAI